MLKISEKGARSAEDSITPVSKEGRPIKSVFFPNLDGLRFFAFFIVYLQHGFNIAVADSQDRGFLRLRLESAIFNSGWAGVSFFFVLSGFLITYLILTEIKVKGRLSITGFYIRRALRIWPLYYLVLFFGFVGYPLVKQYFGFSTYIEAGNPLYYLLFLSNFEVIKLGDGHGALSTNITWSVAVEEQFYLVWPLLFFFAPPKFYKYLFLIIILMSACFRYYYHGDIMVNYYHSLSVISDMAVGGLAAYLSLNFKRFREVCARMPRWLICAIYALGLLVVIFRKDIFIGSALGTFERLVISLFFVFIVLEQNYCEHSLLKMSKLKLISRLGIYTYGLYLLHPVAITIIVSILKVFPDDNPTASSTLLVGVGGLLLSTAMSVISYHLIEKRFLNLKRRFTYVPSAQTSGQ